MNKLTEADKKRATEALAKCAAATKDIDDPKELNEAAFDILYKELGDKPELLKRACEGYNSAKSVYRLGAADDNTRGDSFALLDAPELAKKAADMGRASFLSKAASAAGIKKAQFFTNKESQQMSKKASAPTSAKKEEEFKMRKLGSAEVLGEAVEYIEDIHYSLRKVASEYKEVGREAEEAEKKFISDMSSLTPAMRKQAAELLVGAYGEVGKLLVDLYNAAAPMNKIASYAQNKYKGDVKLQDTGVYKSAWDLMRSHVMLKEAGTITAGFAESALSTLKDIFSSTRCMTKEAGIPLPSYGSDVLGKTILGQEVLENLPKLTDKGKDVSKLEREIMTVSLLNALKKHSVKRAFMTTATDPVVARYPLHQVTAAFNAALTELPVHMRDLPPSAFSALLKGRTIARLGRGGAASAADVDQIQSIQQAYGRINTGDITSATQRGE